MRTKSVAVSVVVPCLWIALSLGSAGCTSPDGLSPAGAAHTSKLELERFVKRLYLDLSGAQPTADELASTVGALAKRDGPEARGAIADDLIARPSFATLYVGELEDTIFGGAQLAHVFDVACIGVQASDPACAACSINPNDACACSCPSVEGLASERDALGHTADDLAAGTSTSEIGRRYAATRVFQLNGGSPEGIADRLFQSFLGRPPDPNEIKNVRAFVFGTSVSTGASGLLFHRVGANYADLVDIVFTSEVYREASVRGVFLRYLGREPSPAELSVFSGTLDPDAPDVRGVIRAVVSSAEYFAQ